MHAPQIYMHISRLIIIRLNVRILVNRMTSLGQKRGHMEVENSGNNNTSQQSTPGRKKGKIAPSTPSQSPRNLQKQL